MALRPPVLGQAGYCPHSKPGQRDREPRAPMHLTPPSCPEGSGFTRRGVCRGSRDVARGEERPSGRPALQGSDAAWGSELDEVSPVCADSLLPFCPQGSRGDPGDAGPRGDSGQPGPKVCPLPTRQAGWARAPE